MARAAREPLSHRFPISKGRLRRYDTTCEFQSPDALSRKRQIEIVSTFIDLAHDTGALGIKVRPNGFPDGVSEDQTIRNIGAGLRQVGDLGAAKGIEIWMEVHGRGTQNPPNAAKIRSEERRVGKQGR